MISKSRTTDLSLLEVLSVDNDFHHFPLLCVEAKTKKDIEKLNRINDQQYEINKTDISVLNSILVYLMFEVVLCWIYT